MLRFLKPKLQVVWMLSCFDVRMTRRQDMMTSGSEDLRRLGSQDGNMSGCVDVLP